MPKGNYIPVYGDDAPQGQSADSPNSGRVKYNESIDDLDTRTAALEDNPAEVPIGGDPVDGDTLYYDAESGLYLPGEPPEGAEIPTEYLTGAEGDERYPRITGDPGDGQFFKWQESSGTLIPTDAPSGGGGGYTPAWIAQSGAGSIFASVSDGDPLRLANLIQQGIAVGQPTPGSIGVSTARCVMFSLPKAMSLSKIHLLSYNSSTGVYKFAIYESSGAKVYETGALNSVSSSWVSHTVGSSVSLSANTNYWWCVAVTGTTGTAGFNSLSGPVVNGQYGANAGPLGGRSIGLPVYAQFAVSASTFPTTLPTIAQANYGGGGSGSVPFAFFEGNAS